MVETYKQLKQIITKDFKKYSNEDLVELYKNSKDDQIIAELYCRNLKYWYRLGQKIFTISEEEKVSIILEKIYSCILEYDRNKNASFVSFVYVAVNNVFGGIKIKDKFKNRYKELDMLNLDNEIPGTDGLNIIDTIEDPSTENEFRAIILKLAIEKDNTLTKYEKRFCQIVIDNPGIELKGIGEIMHVCNQRIWWIQKCLKEKIKISLFI